ncbi:MAG: hypothetical protein HY000_24505 [Planctomycetes bacterium]|nr:hypothetical protein [Planctomycetota bacterium]
MLDIVDETICVETGLADKRETSRFLKTVLRQRLSGDFLFLDADTVAVAPLDHLFKTTADFCALPMRGTRKNQPTRNEVGRVYQALGWRWPLKILYNSGVMFFRDTPAARMLGDEWHQRWRETLGIGCVLDEPALNRAIDVLRVSCEDLTPRYNALVLGWPGLFRTCAIAHFLESCETGITLMSHLVQVAKSSRTMDWAAYDRCITEGHPWAPNPAAWQLWRSKNYGRALTAKLKKTLRPGCEAQYRSKML